MLIIDRHANQFIDNFKHKMNTIKRFIDNQVHRGKGALQIIDNRNIDLVVNDNVY